MSLGPPGAKGTISFIGLVGNGWVCACARLLEACSMIEIPRQNDGAKDFMKYL
jgi:hypothetical protein